MEFHNNPKVSALLTLAVACFAFHYLLNDDDSRADPVEYKAFLGSWTDADGEPGNSLTFYHVRVPRPKSYFGFDLYEGHARFLKNFGADEMNAIWNYGSHQPVEINIVFPNRTLIAAIKVLDHDHLLLRPLEPRPHASDSPGFFDSPETLRLVRTVEPSSD